MEVITIKDHTIAFLFPNKDRDGKSVDPLPHVEDVSRSLSKMLGGCFRLSAESEYSTVLGRRVHEDTTVIVASFGVDDFFNVVSIACSAAIRLAKYLNQETVGLYVDHKFILVEADVSNDSRETPRNQGLGNPPHEEARSTRLFSNGCESVTSSRTVGRQKTDDFQLSFTFYL